VTPATKGPPALSQVRWSMDASRDTLARVRMKLIDIVHEVGGPTGASPGAVRDGLARRQTLARVGEMARGG